MRASLLCLTVIIACGPATPAPQAPQPAPPSAVTTSVPALAPAAPPVARTVDVVDDLFGLKVPDPYRWMEGTGNVELSDWLRAQGAYADAYLGRIDGRDQLLARIRELGLGTAMPHGATLAGGRTFYYLIGAGEQVAKLMVRGKDGKPSVLVDPAHLGGADTHATIESFAPSPDGKLVAYDLAEGGSEISSIHIVDVDSARDRPAIIDHVWGEFTASWLADSSGLFYTQMAAAPAAGADPLLNMTVRLHRLGDPLDRDVRVLAGVSSPTLKLAPEEFPILTVPVGSPWVIAIAAGAQSEIRVAITRLADLDRSGAARTGWQPVAEYADSVEKALVHGDRLYLLSFKGASNRRILSVPLAHPALAGARVELAEDPAATLVGMAAARDALYAEQMVDGHARILRLPWSTRKAEPVPLPFDGWVGELVTDPTRAGALINIEGWVQPSAFYGTDGRGQPAFRPLGIATQTGADYSGIVAEEVEAVSADGTRVPLSILHRKDLVLDGSHPAILDGYGGYGLSTTPFFGPSLLAWLERGGVLAYAHVRGGGEKGYRWQSEGSHEHKLNGIDDFIACAQYLVAHRLTSKPRLGAQGASGGGILIGRALTERPDLFAAATIQAGAVNPLRILADLNGANQKVELGDPETEAGFKSILAMDPYQHVVPGAAYPAVLFTIGLNDNRVAPWMTGKMAARMQAASSSRRPVLIRVEGDAGHGFGNGSTRDQIFARRADTWSFMLEAFGNPDFTVQSR